MAIQSRNYNYRTFTDFDMNFLAHPETGDLVKIYDDKCITESVKHLVLTQFYERPFHPEIGCYITGLLFELNSFGVKHAIEETIKDVIRNFEPRATNTKVTAVFYDGDNSYTVDISFTIAGLIKTVSFNIDLERIR